MINVITSLWSPVWVCSKNKVVWYVTCQPNGSEIIHNNNTTKQIHIYFFISNSNLLKAQSGATLVQTKYTKEHLNYRKRRIKLQKNHSTTKQLLRIYDK